MPPEDSSSPFEQFNAKLKELERRLSALEHPTQSDAPHPIAHAVPATANIVPGSELTAQLPPGVFSVLGTAVLGMAGAYLLRAAAEAQAVPSWVVIAIALVYAAAWLMWAAKLRAGSALARHAYAITAALILSPMLWEVTVRFRMLEPPVTAAILVAFAFLAMALAWRRDLSNIMWVGMLTAVITALILMPAARAPVVFTLALLLMALMSEFAADRGRWLGLRVVVAFAADLAVLISILILGDSEAVPSEYRAVSAGLLTGLVIALFVIYAVSLAIRSLILRLKISVFETLQIAVTVLLVAWVVIQTTHGTGAPALAVACLIVGAACYFAAFGLLLRHRERPGFLFYATCSVVFVLTASFLALSPTPLVLSLCSAAILTTALAVILRNTSLCLHCIVYLSGAVYASGLLGYVGRALAAACPHAPGALPALAATATILCAVIASRFPGEQPHERILRLLPMTLAVGTIAALAIAVLGGLVARGGEPSFPLLAVIRTGVTCTAALLLAFAGSRWRRLELVWLAYAAFVLGSVKFIVEDLRIGSPESLAASLFMYGAVLLLISRLVRAKSVARRS